MLIFAVHPVVNTKSKMLLYEYQTHKNPFNVTFQAIKKSLS